jgi:hypothetical protein
VSGHGPTTNAEQAKIQIIVTVKDSTQRESGRLRVLIVVVIALSQGTSGAETGVISSE